MSTPEERAKRATYMREWLSKNKDRVNAKRRAKRKSDQDYREKENRRSNKYYHSHPEESRRRHREWLENNKKLHNEGSKRFYWNHIEKERERNRIKSKKNTEKRRELRRLQYIAEYGCEPPPKTTPPETPGLTGKERARELSNQRNRIYRKKHGEEIRKKIRNERKVDPDKYHIGERNRKARKRGADGSYTRTEWRELCAKYDNRCVCCGEKKPLTADHVIPVTAQGTSNYISNIQPLCDICNKRKMQKTIDYRPLWGNKIMWCNHVEED